MFDLKTRALPSYNVIVLGGGVAGIAAALRAAQNGAKVLLAEQGGALGGTLTEGLVPNIMDAENKGGLVRDLLAFLTRHDMTCARIGKKTDEDGKRIPGRMIDIEGAKFFFEDVLQKAGVTVLYHTQLSAAAHAAGHIESILLSTICGNYTATADIYIDATGFGALAACLDLSFECGSREEKYPNPASMNILVGGLPSEYDGTDTPEDKAAYGKMLEENGISISAEHATIVKLPALSSWTMGFNFEYGIFPDDILAFSKAIRNGRAEAFTVLEKHKKIKGYENLYAQSSASYFGMREGRRVFGLYRITDDDIISGRKFPDGICLVTARVDVHKLHAKDTTECERGIYSKPYHIPFRALIPIDTDNMLLAGRCISGDFYPFASYRMMGNMMTAGEAAGYAAAVCAKEGIAPSALSGARVRGYMESLGHTL